MKLNRTGSVWNRNERNNINENWETIEDVLDELNRISADGKLTDEQYEDFVITLNGLIKKGELSVNDINKNLGKIDQSFLSEDLLQQIAGNAPINAVPADKSITSEKVADKAITNTLLSDDVNNRILKGGYKIGVNLGNCFFNEVTGTIEIDIKNIRVALKSGETSRLIPGTTFNLKRNNSLYIDLSESTPALKVGVNPMHSAAEYGEGAFLDDKKILLLSNLYDQIIGEISESFKIQVEITRKERLLANKTSDGLYNIYIQSKFNDRKYTKFELKTEIIPYDESNLKSNVNCTEFIGAKIAYRKVDNTFDIVGNIASGGAWSCAIRESGVKDSIGGHAHGDEVEKYLVIKLNGVTDQFTSELRSYEEIEFIAASELYRESSTFKSLEKIGTHFKSYVMNYEDGLIIDSKVLLTKPLTLIFVYLGMMSVLKDYTNKAITDIDLEVNDLTVNSPVHTKRPNIKRVDVYGTNVYVKSTALVQETPSIPITKVEETYYNKIYYDLVEDGFESPANAVYRQKTQFEIDLK